MADPALNVPPIELRHRLRIAMEYAGLKPADMARDLGVARTTVTNYLGGKTRASRSVVTSWAMRCGVSRYWLETGQSPDGAPTSTIWYPYYALKLQAA